MNKIKTILTKITLSVLTILLLTIGSFNVKSYKKEIYAAELNTTTNLLGVIGTYYLQNLGMQLSSAASIGNQFLNYITNVLGLATSSVLAYFQVKQQSGKTQIDVSNAGVSLLNSFKNWIVENGTTNIFTYGNALDNFNLNNWSNAPTYNKFDYQVQYNLSNVQMERVNRLAYVSQVDYIGYSSPYINNQNYPNLYNYCVNLFNHNHFAKWSTINGTNYYLLSYKFNDNNYLYYTVKQKSIYTSYKMLNGVQSYNISNNITTAYLETHYMNNNMILKPSNETEYNSNFRNGVFLYNNKIYFGSVAKTLDANNNDVFHIELIDATKVFDLNELNTENNTINYENINNNNIVSDNLNNSEQIYRLTIQNTENIENIEELLAYIEQSISNLQSIITSNVVSIESGATDEEIEDSNWFRTIVSALSNFFSTPIAWIGDLFDSLKSHMTSGWNSLVNGIKDIFDVDVDDSITTELTETIEDSETAEGYLTDVFENTIEDIDLTPVTTFGTKFSNSTNWVKDQYENLTNNSPYGTLVTYSLSIGFILLLIGRGIF